jgi:hypothetical protein
MAFAVGIETLLRQHGCLAYPASFLKTRSLGRARLCTSRVVIANCPAEIGKAGPGNEADIAGANYCNAHRLLSQDIRDIEMSLITAASAVQPCLHEMANSKMARRPTTKNNFAKFNSPRLSTNDCSVFTTPIGTG